MAARRGNERHIGAMIAIHVPFIGKRRRDVEDLQVIDFKAIALRNLFAEEFASLPLEFEVVLAGKAFEIAICAVIDLQKHVDARPIPIEGLVERMVPDGAEIQ